MNGASSRPRSQGTTASVALLPQIFSKTQDQIRFAAAHRGGASALFSRRTDHLRIPMAPDKIGSAFLPHYPRRLSRAVHRPHGTCEHL